MYSLSICLACITIITFVHGFEPLPLTRVRATTITTTITTTTRSISTTTIAANSPTLLFSVPPKRIVRRDLKKRTTKRQRIGESRNIMESVSQTQPNTKASIVQIETRPLVRSKSIEAGEDYWIDETEFLKYSQREEAKKNRKASEGEISREKLQKEVVAPYKQNWIGLLSVGVIVLAVIVKEFPDLLNSPIIPIPDL